MVECGSGRTETSARNGRSGRWVVNRIRGLAIGWRLAVGLLLAGPLVFVTRYVDWQSPTADSLRPFVFYVLGLIAFLSALLIQSFSWRFNVFDVAVNTAVICVLGCLMFPSVSTDHSHRSVRPAPAPRPASSR
jgi:hypothetical protein